MGKQDIMTAGGDSGVMEEPFHLTVGAFRISQSQKGSGDWFSRSWRNFTVIASEVSGDLVGTVGWGAHSTVVLFHLLMLVVWERHHLLYWTG